MRRWPILGWCETCGKLFYTASTARKFCDNPRCRGWIKHV